MTARAGAGYRFATRAQWNACLVRGADVAEADGVTSIRPLAAFGAPTSITFESVGAAVPAMTRAAEVLWRDGSGLLQRLAAGDDHSTSGPAPDGIRTATRMVASGDVLWVRTASGCIEAYDVETLVRRVVVAMSDARTVDVAADGRGGAFVLVARGDAWEAVPVDPAGRKGTPIPLRGADEMEALVYVREGRRFVALAEKGARLLAFDRKGGLADTRLGTAVLGTRCFVAMHLAADARGRVFVGGVDEHDAMLGEIAVLDAFGMTLGRVALPEAPTGVAAGRDDLVVTSARGMWRLAARDPVADAVTQVEAAILTPMLHAPDVGDGRRWLRIEAVATLPPGSALEVAYASTDDETMRGEILGVSADRTISPGRRAQMLRARDGIWSTAVVFHGNEARAIAGGGPLAVPLHDVRARYLWVAVILLANAGAVRPTLSRLTVLYPGRTLMEQLPAIFQREEALPRSFGRSLVGVLETSTQELDARIGALGSLIDPRHAPVPWLDYVARWLGLPWDDAMTAALKRRLLEKAETLASARGTRGALETFLACVMPEPPRRFRVTDLTADHGFATLAGGACVAARLPSLLGGAIWPRAELGMRFVLGARRLPSSRDDAEADGPEAGRIRVDVAASAAERRAWEPWLPRLVDELVPLTARAELRWVSSAAVRDDRLGGDLTLDDAPESRLGTDAVTGVAQLPRRRGSLSDSGSPGGLRL